jgi:hypothetical protein
VPLKAKKKSDATVGKPVFDKHKWETNWDKHHPWAVKKDGKVHCEYCT